MQAYLPSLLFFGRLGASLITIEVAIVKKLVSSRTGRTYCVPSMEEVMAACQADEGQGWCIKCGSECFGLEPDARKCECEDCGAAAAYGAEELMLMGLYHE